MGMGVQVRTTTVMETELFASVEAGDLEKFKELIKKETKETIDQVDFYGYTALHAAAENGRLEMIPPLLEAGADINRATYDATFTSLHHALAKGHMECARLLVESGADVNVQDEEELTPLHCAARDGYGDCVLILCKAGADCYKTNNEGKTAKDLADMATEQDTVEFLAKAETG